MFSHSEHVHLTGNTPLFSSVILVICLVFKLKMVFSRWAVMVLTWDCLIYFHILLLRYFVPSTITSTETSRVKSGWIGFDIFYCFVFISFPFYGLLADVKIGRHRTIIIGIVFCFLSMILVGCGYVVNSFYPSSIILWTTYGIAYVLEGAGYCSFKANIVQYNIDQIVGASSREISALIYWHSVCIPIMFTLFELGRCLVNQRFFLLIDFILAGITVSLVLVSHSMFKHKLENITLIKNPIKLIVRVLCYARKHKYPENRSALTYWEEEAPSRLDLGKDKYGGPFTVEEIEDTKTVFRMLPLFIAVISFAVTDEVYHWIFLGIHSSGPINCLISTQFVNFLTSTLFLLFYLSLVKVFCAKYIPGILKIITCGQVFALLTQISKFAILQFFPGHETSTVPFASKMLLLPQVFHGFTFAFIAPATLEFTIAQSPVHMRGVMVGMWFASLGCGYLVNINIKYLFDCHNEYLCTASYYYLTKSGVVFVILIVFAILARRYKYRVRENEVNVLQIVDDHYQRYMEQEEMYKIQFSK